MQQPDPAGPAFRFSGRPDPYPGDDRPDWMPRIGRRWRRGGGGPLRRDPEDRLAGGIAAGVGAWRGVTATTVRILLVVAVLFSQGWVVPLYFLGWLLIPPRGTDTSIWSRARHDSRGIALATALASLLAVFLFLAGVLNDRLLEVYGWPQVVSVACLALIWRNALADEQAVLRRLVQPLESLGGAGASAARGLGRASALRLSAAAVLLLIGVGWLLSAHESIAMLRPLAGVVLVAAAIVLLLGPWWLRVARDLVLERQARARAEERADMAARVHDSVLQTLALIQRRSTDPQAVVQLARAQERELRSWLFEGRPPGDGTDVASVAEGVRQIQRDVEARHGVPVEVVTVGDCPLDEHLGALLAAAREATVNAAKWSGASVISLFAEVEPDRVAVAVRDRGKGFDPSAVPDDRKGVAESIRGRMARHGGTATVQSAPGEGTKVTLTMPRGGQPAGQAPFAGEARR